MARPPPSSPSGGTRRPGPTPTPLSTFQSSVTSRPLSSASTSEWDDGVNSSFISTTSSQPFFPSAPTPNNTFSPPDAYDGQSTSQLGVETGYTSNSDIRLPYDPIHPVLPTTSGLSPHSSLHQPTSLTSHASSHLISSSQQLSIPHSTRPIPDPPLSLHSGFSSHLADQTTPITETTSIGTPPSAHKPPLDLASTESRNGLRGQGDRDAARLRQLGYDAVLGRDYTFWSSLAISWLNIGALQGTINAVSACYSYGGPMMILVAWPISGIFCFFLTLTLSELASAYPVSGAMSSWAWKLARGSVGGERLWAWTLGGFILLVTWEIVNIVAGTMSISFHYEKKSWHLFFMFLVVLLICGTVGSTGWGRSHRFWLISGLYGFCMWVVLCITLLATNATKHRPGPTFTDFYNTTGWSSKPYVYLLGWQFTTIASGADASAHMAEETQNPSRNVPNAMTASVIGTYLLGYISIILLLVSVSPEDASTVRAHVFPFGYILTKAISEHGAIAVCSLMIVVLHLQVLAQLQASSRFVFAMARDNAMPFSNWIRRTNAAKNPIFANWLVVALCVPFASMTLGSRSALYSVLAVTACTMSYVGYIVPAGLYLFSGKNLQSEGRTTWSLRRWSKPVAVIGLFYGSLLIVAQTFPGSRPVTAATMSWSPVIIVGTMILCFITWKCYGDRHYSGPIRAVTKWETGVEIDLSSALNSSRSKPSATSPIYSPKGNGDFNGLHHSPDLLGLRPPIVSTETESSLKLALEPHMPSVVHTITVDSRGTAHTGRGHGAESGVTVSTGWTDGTDSSGWTSGVESGAQVGGRSDMRVSTGSGETIRSEDITPTTSRVV
ncbi:amino acid/metabolite permease [Kwoniella heveanensis CBS 569]|nr:amino acid/metabolite permease [Kwoniella heveanensis CBS 569]